MRRSTLVDAAGPGDPELVGRDNFRCLSESLRIDPSWRVLDFGCGFGRTSVPLAEFLAGGHVVGVDIVPEEIELCRSVIAPRFPNTSFICTDASNRNFDWRIKGSVRDSEAEFFNKHAASFDLIVAFSVFTHFDPGMARRYISLLRSVAKPGGYLFLTWFFDHDDNPPEWRLDSSETFRETGDLHFVAFSRSYFDRIVGGAELRTIRVSFGTWRGPSGFECLGQHYQDVAILQRPVELPADFDADRYLQLNPDVAQAGVDAVSHYLHYGYREGRLFRADTGYV